MADHEISILLMVAAKRREAGLESDHSWNEIDEGAAVGIAPFDAFARGLKGLIRDQRRDPCSSWTNFQAQKKWWQNRREFELIRCQIAEFHCLCGETDR